MAAEITSITGLQNLNNLAEFRADWNALETIDLSNLTNLTDVDVSDCEPATGGANSLTSINLSGCTSLSLLYMDDSDFSGGFPDLSDCTSLTYFDADQCSIQGPLDLTNLPLLEGFDLSGNSDLASVTISSSQPLGVNSSVNLDNTALTQTTVDNILLELASGSLSNGDVSMNGTAIAYPSNEGVSAVRELSNRGWIVAVVDYATALNLTNAFSSSAESCEASGSGSINTPGGYIHKDDTLIVGTYLYDDIQLFTTKPDGWYASEAGVSYWVSGSTGLIVSSSVCV